MSLSHLSGFSKPSPVNVVPATQVGLNLARNLRFLAKTEPKGLPDVLELSGKTVHTLGKTEIPWSEHLAKLCKVQSYAQKAQRFMPNLSHRHYGAMVVLSNGLEGLGTNIEASRKDTFCDLRYAMTNALHQFLDNAQAQEKDAAALDESEPEKQPESLPQVKTIYLANANLQAEPPVPCSDCQSWLASRFLSPKTQVISLELDSTEQSPLIRSRTVKDLLPLHQGRETKVRFTTDKPMRQLPVNISKSAEKMLAAEPNLQDLARSLMQQAKQGTVVTESERHKNAKLPTGAAVLLSPAGLTNRQTTFSWSNRWTEPADLRSASNALDRVERRRQIVEKLPGFLQGLFASWLAPQKVKAIAYYGNEPDLPPITSLGRIARRNQDSDALVFTVENDVIQARTIHDYTPEMYHTCKS